MNNAATMNEVIHPDAVAAASNLFGVAWQWIVAMVVGLPTLGVLVSNRITRLRAEHSDRLAISARDSTVQGLVAEVERKDKEIARIAGHNAALVAYFEEAQLKIVEIARENQRLQGTIEELQRKIVGLLKMHGGATA